MRFDGGRVQAIEAPGRWTRRQILLAAPAAGLCVGLWPLRSGSGAGDAAPRSLGGWIRIGTDGSVCLCSNASEMGQGSPSALAQILAEELEVDWNTVTIDMAPLAQEFFNPVTHAYMTGGSTAVAGMFNPLRTAAAKARTLLTEAAARRWDVAASACSANAGAVLHAASGRRLSYGALAKDAARLPAPKVVSLKPPTSWQLIGRSVPRRDLSAKVTGTACFGIDAGCGDDLHALPASIRHCPVAGGQLVSVDRSAAMDVPGVHSVVPLKNAVAVVGEHYWAAKAGAERLRPEWKLGGLAGANTQQIAESLRAATHQDGKISLVPGEKEPSVRAAHALAVRKSLRTIERTYEVPLLAHATLEPMNATARVSDQSAELWVPTQVQSQLRRDVARVLALPESAVTIHTSFLGGGFGRRLKTDFGVEAALVARAAGVPVKLLWSREEDMRHDYYRPSAAIRLSAALGPGDRLDALRVQIGCLDSDEPTGGLIPSVYSFPNLLVTYGGVNPGVPIGAWRSVDHTQNVFALECFLDELAGELGVSPLTLRRQLLGRQPRAVHVLDAVVELAGPTPTGRARGLALTERSGSFVAEIAEVSLTAQRSLTIHRVYAAIDCGTVVNPSTVEAQMQGGILFGLSAALFSEITIVDGAVQEANFDRYPLLTMRQAPEVIVRILDAKGAPPSGVGEPPVPPIAPALCNALAAAGVRCRVLPVTRQGLTVA
jgi:isoquinoline 1-oxidoreductase beta subunit